MCGIAGILDERARPVDPGTIAAMVAAIAHRGPDQHDAVVGRSIGLGAARLSLVDPSDAGAQPFGDDHRSLALNGEIYNHRDLRRALEAEGRSFRGGSDTEVLFHALSHWGVAATLPRLEGMFAFAFVDFDAQEVFLGRDPLGIKPLVWRHADGLVSWASEAKGLDPVQAIEPDAVQSLFAVTGRIDRSRDLTAFAGVRQLPPGHYLHAVVGGGPPELITWWRLADQADPALYGELDGLDPDVLADRLESRLADAVNAMAVCDAPIGTFLSGGVDSSLMASLARPLDRSPRLYAADVGGGHSEVAAARRTAAHLDRPLTVAPFPRSALLDDWASATWHLEAPVITHVNALPFGRLAATASADGVKAALTGEGADELFFGYGELAAARYQRALEAPRRFWQGVTGRLPEPYSTVLAPRGPSQADFLQDLVGHFGSAHLRSVGAEAFAFLPPQEAERHGRVIEWLGEHLTTLLHRNDAMGMAVGLETRFPYLDTQVVRFGVNVPLKAKVASSRHLVNRKHPFVQNKAIVRQVAARRLPADVAQRPKAGFPMYGHRHLSVAPSFWCDGYVADLLELPRRVVGRLESDADPYYVAKLASVEVFGRLFSLGQGIDDVTAHVRRHASITDR